MAAKRSTLGLIPLLALLVLGASGCTNNRAPLREVLDLGGTWQLRLDTARAGIVERWYAQAFPDKVNLPGTLDENRKGFPNRDTTEMHLNRVYTYTGPAWYKKEIVIPESFGGKHVELIMERTKVSHVWLDSLDLGTSVNLFTPHVYDLTEVATPGRHVLTVRIDNDPGHVPVGGTHAYSEDTQTNWNGILGVFQLVASNPTRLAAVRVTPDLKGRKARVRLHVFNPGIVVNSARIVLKADAWNTGKPHDVPEKTYDVVLTSADTTFEVTYPMGDGVLTWSEFDPALYRMNVTLENTSGPIDEETLDFGMREFRTSGTNFTINGLKTFLRGKHEAAVFPLTGYPPMDTTGWARVFRIAKTYGINHYRFHSWTPPEAAFRAADVAGIYLQPETPIWYAFNAHEAAQVAFMKREARNILDAYGNHASMVMFALGNEIGQDREVLKQMVAEYRAYDPRPLYAQGSNNRAWDAKYAEGDDYWTTFRTAPERDDLSSDVRTSIAFLDSKEGGILNTVYPSTRWTYTTAIRESPVPVVGHEIGQYQVYPNYREMSKYKGVLKPWNFEVFRRRLQEKGMLDQADAFFKASGAFSALCYRADIETAIRTPGFGGFQLLDLQDYPGQGTALVGLLDAFMDSKGLITPEDFRRFNDRVVLLLEMDKYTWTSAETFRGDVVVANYSPAALENSVIHWQMVAPDGSTIQEGRLPAKTIPQGGISPLGRVEVPLNRFDRPRQVTLRLDLEGTGYTTSYPVWVYPANVSTEPPAGVTVATRLDANTRAKLEAGGRVVLFPDFARIKEHSVGGQFIPEFWNYGMFTSLAVQFNKADRVSVGTMGILTNPAHPLLAGFPTESHSNWQWWSITKNSRPLILDGTAPEDRPIIQVIDNINRNHKLGLVFEYKVGAGRLLVCMSNLPAIDRPEARALYATLLQYAGSDRFNPARSLPDEIGGWLEK